jgi:NADPH2:quinone reductase
VQVTAASGARVIATAHGRQEIEAAKSARASTALDYLSPNLAGDILDATGDTPVDHVVEAEFGKNIDTLAQVIAERGRTVTYGSALPMTPTLPFYPLLFKAVSIDLVLVYLLNRQERTTAIENLTGLLERDATDLRISQTLPLEGCAKAHEIVAAGQRAGSVILTM